MLLIGVSVLSQTVYITLTSKKILRTKPVYTESIVKWEMYTWVK